MADLNTIYALTLAPARGGSHAERLESFYRRQARHYDAFRDRLLQGRHDMLRRLPLPDRATWIDIGCGTGRNLEFLGSDIPRLNRVVLVDLCPSLLEVARLRVHRHGWPNVSLIRTDATRSFARPGTADVVTFSYALTMIPDWFKAVEQARLLLKPGGYLGVVDFYVSRRHPTGRSSAHGWLTRHGWPAWFDRDGVRPSDDLLPYLQWQFEQETLSEHVSRMPYLPVVRVPYFLFTGRLRAQPPVPHAPAARACEVVTAAPPPRHRESR